MTIPGYWMNEQSGVLKPVVLKYLKSEPLDAGEVATMRAYLRQWIFAEGFLPSVEITGLRLRVDELRTNSDIRLWLNDALDAGIDPL